MANVQEVRLVDFNDEPVDPLRTGDPVPVFSSGGIVVVDQGFLRPADTTQYTAGDVVGPAAGSGTTSLIQFALPYTSGFIYGASLIDSINPAVVLQSEAWLFDMPVSAQADNAAFAPTDGDVIRSFGVISFVGYNVGGATDGSGGSTVYHNPNLNIPFYVPFVYVQLVARNAYTPAASERIYLRLMVGPN